jgi:hypothetical protein
LYISVKSYILNVYSFSLYNINVRIIIYNSLIYKVLFITYNRLLKDTYINYNTIEFLKGITLYYNIYKRVLFIIYNIYNRFNKYIYNIKRLIIYKRFKSN